jgi:hypothetical protein
MIALRHLGLGIAAVERLGPGERGGLGGAPCVLARARGNSPDGDLLGEGRAGQGLRQLAAGGPHLDLLGEPVIGAEIGIGTVDALHEEVLSSR